MNYSKNTVKDKLIEITNKITNKIDLGKLNHNKLVEHIYKLIDNNKKDDLVSALDELLIRKKQLI